LKWQARLVGFPRLSRAPDATPFVTLYAQGRLVGCFGSSEGSPGQRLARAFIHAVEDTRYGGFQPHERRLFSTSVSYLRAFEERSLGELDRVFELGTHGLAAIVPGKSTALLLPAVAVDERSDVAALVEVLRQKLGVASFELDRVALYTFEADTVVARQTPASDMGSPDAIDAAAAWLAAQVDSKGRVRFGVDARARVNHEVGEFFHGRAAVVVQALGGHGGYPRVVSRARRWLHAEIRAALGGRASPEWPRDPAAVAGTVALATLAGVDASDDLVELARDPALGANAWHTAQVVAALGKRAPKPLYRACVARLGDEPWAPWTLLAARALRDEAVVLRVADVLAASIRREPPYVGGANVTRTPEVALTALAVEALAPLSTRAARDAAARGRTFLSSTQFLDDTIPAPLDPSMAHGAFPLSCTFDALRSDVTGHALLALLGAKSTRATDRSARR
jgi:AMMECR1 domain-containing protein